MIEIPLTKNLVTTVDECDMHLLKWKWRASYDKSTKTHYAICSRVVDGKLVNLKIHQAILGRPLNGKVIDHIDGDTLNNQRKNLRIVTNRENLSKRRERLQGKTSSRYVGVGWHKRDQKWFAQIYIQGRKKFLGYFLNEESARDAYLENLNQISFQSNLQGVHS